MQETILHTIRQNFAPKPQATYLVALSGGCDSVGLLFLMQALQKEIPFQTVAVHIHHGLRQNADGDEGFCIDLCARVGVPLWVFREDVASYARLHSMSEEEAGRILRYRWLKEAARRSRAQGILTAHHLDDQAETILMNLFRGSGIKGMGGMAPRRDMGDGLELFRPLLAVRRDDLRKYLQSIHEKWREDESNQDERYTRNYIRRSVLPACLNRFPGGVAHIGQMAEHFREMDEYMTAQADKWLADYAEGLAIPLAPFEEAPPGLKTYICLQWLAREGVGNLNARHLQSLKEAGLLRSGSRIELPGGIRLQREQEQLRLLPTDSGQSEEDVLPRWFIRDFPWHGDLKIPDTLYTKWMDYAIISDGLTLRHRKKGDYFYLKDGQTKSLSRYMIDEKIPLSQRDKLWLLADGSHILWIVGGPLSRRAYIHEHTKRVAEVKIDWEGDIHGKALC